MLESSELDSDIVNMCLRQGLVTISGIFSNIHTFSFDYNEIHKLMVYLKYMIDSGDIDESDIKMGVNVYMSHFRQGLSSRYVNKNLILDRYKKLCLSMTSEFNSIDLSPNFSIDNRTYWNNKEEIDKIHFDIQAERRNIILSKIIE